MLFSGSEFRRGKGVTSCGGTKKLAAGPPRNTHPLCLLAGRSHPRPCVAGGGATLQIKQPRGRAKNVTWLLFRGPPGGFFWGAGHAATERPFFGRFPSCPATFAEKSTIARPRL